ncbi:hypothetical protein [Nocardia sp. NPDC046763]|uniref:hypothetical protein n=1 Tax=Nocardia sp. NPDC046763 TaxID=3155256 RepID=UPI00340060E6
MTCRYRALAATLCATAATHLGAPAEDCELAADAVRCGNRRVSLRALYALSAEPGESLAADGHWGGTPRSVAVDAQLFQVAVDPGQCAATPPASASRTCR